MQKIFKSLKKYLVRKLHCDLDIIYSVFLMTSRESYFYSVQTAKLVVLNLFSLLSVFLPNEKTLTLVKYFGHFLKKDRK